MAFEVLKSALRTANAQALEWSMSLDAWASDAYIMAQKVAKFRDYVDGLHDAKLSTEMANMLRVSTDDNFDRFNANVCGKVVYTESDRLNVKRITSGTEGADQWVEDVKRENRFDGLQNDVHESCLTDGDTYVMAAWDNDARRVVLTAEPAYDGSAGMLVIHDPSGNVKTAIKVWQQGEDSRVNVYYPDRVEKYIGGNTGGLTPYQLDGQPWPLPWPVRRVPVVHFANRQRGGSRFGLSEIENAIPLQNALNRTLTSLVMASELTAFQVKVAQGFVPPAGLTPGMWIQIGDEPIPDGYQEPKAYVLESGQVVPYIQAADWLVQQIGKITDTPLPEFMGGDTASGESLKQREVSLIGKCQRFQVKIGNAWENVFALAHQVQTTFGSAPPMYTAFDCQWDSPELRNDRDVIENAKVLAELGLFEEALRQMAPVFDWGEAKITELIESKRQAEARAATNILSSIPTFSAAALGVPAGNGQQEV